MNRSAQWLTICLCIIVSGLFLKIDLTQSRIKNTSTSKVESIAHRAGLMHWPENTIYGIKQSIKMGIDIVELDVSLTKDDVLVLMHDSLVNRTTDGYGQVSRYTLSEIKNLDAGYFFQDEDGGYPFRGQGIQVSSVEEALSYADKIKLLLDLKEYSQSAITRLCDEIVSRNLQTQVLLGEFARKEGAATIRQWCDSSISSNLNVDELDTYETQIFPRFKHQFILLSGAMVGGEGFEALLQRAQRNHIKLYIYFVNSLEQAEKLEKLGVDGILSNNFEVLMR